MAWTAKNLTNFDQRVGGIPMLILFRRLSLFFSSPGVYAWGRRPFTIVLFFIFCPFQGQKMKKRKDTFSSILRRKRLG